MKSIITAVTLVLCTAVTGPAFAWGAKGHEYVGAIADQLLHSTAQQRVKNTLGYKLATAATWADCVRSVYKSGNQFAFKIDPNHPEYTASCTAFENAAEQARMEDYARRNWTNCSYTPGHGCHEAYHFADVDKQHDHYDRSYAGTSNHDIVSAINAAVAKLQGKPVPAPFSIKDNKEAVLMLAHFVGDLHQPLHVGAVYLAADGSEVNPDSPGADPVGTETRGGNSIADGSTNLHSEWDAIPTSVGSKPTAAILTAAKAVPPTALPADQLASAWATDTIVASQTALSGISYTGTGPHHWSASFANRPTYLMMKQQLQTAQLTKAGAHLAELLNLIWP